MENLCNISVIKDLFERHHFQFSKTLGQNFLVNPSVCPKIAQNGIFSENCGVIEIGTGIGVLTNELAKRAKKVVAIEIDDRLFPILEETLQEYSHIKIIHADVMKLDLGALIKEEFSGMDVCVCANLPYYITSPIIMMLLEQRLPIKWITVMVQKEAAIRLCAKPGTRDCGAVTFAVRYYSHPKQLFPVSKGSFLPAPKVDSAVIQLEVKSQSEYTVENESFLFALVKAAFSQRRKTLVNPVSSVLKIPKKTVALALENCDLKPIVRAEEVTFEQFLQLSNELFKLK